jgi:hypothetical protein
MASSGEVDGVDDADVAAVPVEKGAALPGTDGSMSAIRLLPVFPVGGLLLALTDRLGPHDADLSTKAPAESRCLSAPEEDT